VAWDDGLTEEDKRIIAHKDALLAKTDGIVTFVDDWYPVEGSARRFLAAVKRMNEELKHA
jgi:hypothetical protein